MKNHCCRCASSSCSGSSRSSFSSSTSCASDTEDETDEDTFYELIDKLQTIGQDALPRLLQNPNQSTHDYRSCKGKKYMDDAKAQTIPSNFANVVTTFDDMLVEDGVATYTMNRASDIYYAFSSAMFQSSEPIMASQMKLIFLKQLEREYTEAKISKNDLEIQKCLLLVNKTVVERDEPWSDEEWLIASKAFFAPIHILHACSRVSFNPHVRRYIFSPVVQDEVPIRFILDSGDYSMNLTK